jgi:hypothetical protein
MITVRPGSHVHRLLHLLSSAGEIPQSALSLLGKERVMTALVHELESVRDIRVGKDGEVFRTKLIRVSGKRGERTVRLYRKGLPVLDGLYPGLLDHYMASTGGHSFTGDQFHIGRNHRVAEALALCMAAGVEMRPYALPPLQKTKIGLVVPNSPCFYIARDFKKTGGESNKTAYTRIVGALFFQGGAYAVYNTRDALMKWSGLGEVKALYNLIELARMNAGFGDVSAALLCGQSADIALRTVLESDKSRRPELRFDKIYKNIYFIPLDQNGVRMVKMLVVPNRNEKLLDALFDNNQRSYNLGSVEYDALVDGRMILSHLDGDIARLIRFREALHSRTQPADVLCFPWQTRFLKSYLGELAGLRELKQETVEAALRA